MSPERIKVLDVVELAAASGRWPKGTRGTVLEVFGAEAALVEVVDDRGHTLDDLELPLDVLSQRVQRIHPDGIMTPAPGS
jgi:hypothetical protein